VRAKTIESAEVEVFVGLRVTDRVAITAYRTLTERLGYGGIMTTLARRTYFRFAVAGSENEALNYIHDLAKQTTVIANPTKETYSAALVKRPLYEDGRKVALVYARDGLYDEGFLRRVSWELGYDRVIGAGTGTAWLITLAPGVDESYAEEILVTRERTKGLLLNPHAETYEWA